MKVLVLGFSLVWGGLIAWPARAQSESIISLFHTNDLHSHYQPLKNELGLGGLARLKTLIDQRRRASPNSLLLDAGDWSEGAIYYNLTAGVDALQLMSDMGYDAVLVGNHDWINGPDHLLNGLQHAKPKFDLLGANFDLSTFARADEFREKILPYSIREVGGVRIALIGMVTYEKVFDRFVAPIRITEPFLLARKLASQLRKQADLIVVLSHNSLKANKLLLQAAPEVDLVIGAHDHVKLLHPIVVPRKRARPGWLVEAGCWGQYLGEVKIAFRPDRGIELRDYKLHAVDATLTEDPNISGKIESLEQQLEIKYGPIFHDHVTDNEFYVSRKGSESLMGDLTTDAYLWYSKADLALDQSNFIYGELYPGPIRSVDVFNANPGVYDPRTGKAWTLKTMSIRGRLLTKIFNLLFIHHSMAEFGIISTAGLQLTYDPMIKPSLDLDFRIVKEALIGGKPIDPDREYLVAMGGGIFQTFELLNHLIPKAISLESARDTGIETWRILHDYLHVRPRWTPQDVVTDNRIRSAQPDLSLSLKDIEWTELDRPSEHTIRARVRAVVRNLGASASSPGPTLSAFANLNGADTTLDPVLTSFGDIYKVPVLPPGGSVSFEWEGLVYGNQKLYPIQVIINGIQVEVNRANNSVLKWLQRDQSGQQSKIPGVSISQSGLN